MLSDHKAILSALVFPAFVIMTAGVICHNFARRRVSDEKLADYSGAEKELRRFWVGSNVVTQEGKAFVRVRSLLWIIGGTLIVVAAILQNFVWRGE